MCDMRSLGAFGQSVFGQSVEMLWSILRRTELDWSIELSKRHLDSCEDACENCSFTINKYKKEQLLLDGTLRLISVWSTHARVANIYTKGIAICLAFFGPTTRQIGRRGKPILWWSIEPPISVMITAWKNTNYLEIALIKDSPIQI